MFQGRGGAKTCHIFVNRVSIARIADKSPLFSAIVLAGRVSRSVQPTAPDALARKVVIESPCIKELFLDA